MRPLPSRSPGLLHSRPTNFSSPLLGARAMAAVKSPRPSHGRHEILYLRCKPLARARFEIGGGT